MEIPRLPAAQKADHSMPSGRADSFATDLARQNLSVQK